MSPTRTRHVVARGSTLLLAMVLLGVLSVIGVAAVALSSQERTNAAIKTHRDRLIACAQAAQGKIYAEMLQYGPSYLGSSQLVPEMRLADGTVLTGGHYGDDPSIVNINTSFRPVSCRQSTTEEFVDLTNRDSYFSKFGSCFLIVARCVDDKGRELEVEFGMNKLF
jgi:hypothetical protein